MNCKPRLLLKIALMACCGFFCSATQAQAQFLGYTSPQTVQLTLATNLACTGAQQLFTVANIGQNQHFATLTVSNTTASVEMHIVGVSAGASEQISDSLIISGTEASFGQTLYGAGYFPLMQVSVQCTGATGTFSLSYSGTSSSAPQVAGSYQQAQQEKQVLGSPANTTIVSAVFPTPFGSSDSLIFAQYTGAAVGGSTLTVNCSSGFASGRTQAVFPLANSVGAIQLFKLPPTKCPLMSVLYTSGGATAGTINVDVHFDQPGTSNTQIANYTHITGTTATAAKATSGVLSSLTIGTPAAGTITMTDLAAISCTGTPATNVVSVITALAGGAPTSYPLNLFFQNGICVKASVAMDLTVGSQ